MSWALQSPYLYHFLMFKEISSTFLCNMAKVFNFMVGVIHSQSEDGGNAGVCMLLNIEYAVRHTSVITCSLVDDDGDEDEDEDLCMTSCVLREVFVCGRQWTNKS